MKGTSTMIVTESTVIEALQMMFDAQMTQKPEILSVQGCSSRDPSGFKIEVNWEVDRGSPK